MNKNIWKTEYSLLFIVLFAVVLFMIPTSFSSKSAYYISKWNSEFNKLEYTFTAMSAQAESEAVNAKTGALREKYMIELVKPYLRLSENKKLKKYKPRYMNGKYLNKKDFYYFSNIYTSDNDMVVGIKDIKDRGDEYPVFMLMFDMNGRKAPNTWGIDIYGVNVYRTGQIKAIGDSWEISELRKDCSKSGTGVSCSHFYRIGGEFNE